MKEGLFKFLFLLLFLISSFYPKKVDLVSCDFIFIDVLPFEISSNSLGVRVAEVNNKSNYYFQTQNWISDNLYISGSFSQLASSKIDVMYNFNFGYKITLENKSLKNIYYDLGYFSKRLETNSNDKQKWLSLSLLFGFNLNNSILTPSMIYFYNNDKDNEEYGSILSIDHLINIGKKIIFKSGIQVYDDKKKTILPFISLKYKI